MPESLQSAAVQWFPGHMAKTRRLIRESLYLVDAVIEIRDARLPESSRNPEIHRLIGKKPRLVLLNKADLADERATKDWCAYYKKLGIAASPADCKSGRGLSRLIPDIKAQLTDEMERRERRGMTGKPVRIMVLGIPNVGKSSFINRIAGGKRAKVEDRPGVTRGKQWVACEGGVDLLDMPGVLWPKFEDPAVGERLAFTGAVKDEVVDTELLASRLLAYLRSSYPEFVCERYKLSQEEFFAAPATDLLELVGRKRGMMIAGGKVNLERAAITVLDEFRAGTIGRITLEHAPKGE